MAVFRLCQLEKSGHNWGVNSLILALWKEAKLTRTGRWHAFQGTCGHQGAHKWRRGPYTKMSVTLELGTALAYSGCYTGATRPRPQCRSGHRTLATELPLRAMLISWCAACTAGSKESQQGGHGSHF